MEQLGRPGAGFGAGVEEFDAVDEAAGAQGYGDGARDRGGEGAREQRQAVPCGGQVAEDAAVGALVAQGGAEAPVGGAAVRLAQSVERDSGVGGVEPAGVDEVGEAQAGTAGERVGSRPATRRRRAR